MELVIHILIALASIASSTYAFLSPSKNRLKVSYGLVAATLASGTFLVVSMHANMVSACMSGLLYLGFVASLLSLANARLAKDKSSILK